MDYRRLSAVMLVAGPGPDNMSFTYTFASGTMRWRAR